MPLRWVTPWGDAGMPWASALTLSPTSRSTPIVPASADTTRRPSARAAAGQLGLPHATLLQRQRATIAQFDLDRRHRAANVEGAFGRVRGSVDVAGRWILLVDDVVTTGGATLAACAIELEAGGAAGVSAITVARER